MTVRIWIRKLFAPKPHIIRKDLFRFRPSLETLEDRTLLSGVVATTTSDLINDIVAANNGTGPTTIQLQAADATNGFDFTSAYNSTNNALPQITANITIEGTSGYTNTIQRSTATGTPAFRLFDVAQGGSLTLENLALTGGLAQGTGSAAEGGAVYSSGTLTLSDVTVKNNQAQGSKNTVNYGTGADALGGGLFVATGNATLNNDTLSGNTAQGGSGGKSHIGGYVGGGAGSGGGMYVVQGTVTLSNDTLSGNIAQGGSGGGYKTAGNGGAGSGGCMYVAGGTVALSNDTLSSNKANGGSVRGNGFIGGGGGAGSGGGMYVAGGTVTLSNDTLSSNTANGSGGQTGAKTGGGGGAGSGGGMDVAQGTVTLSNDTLSSNTANGGNGGVGDYFGGDGGAGSGGGMNVAQGTVTLSNDTLSSNTANGGNGSDAGDALIGSGGNGGNGAGGGLDILSSSTTTLANILIAENGVTAGTAGTGHVNGSAGSTSGPDVSGNVASSDHSLIGDGSDSNLSSGDSGGDLVGYTAAQLYLGSLTNNGGPTNTIALLANSPAIDAGDSNAPGLAATDQRGYARIVGNAVDIGAYEYNATAATTDLSVSGNATSTVAAGGQITYTLTVTNNSSSDQSNVTLVDNLPANTTLVSWTVQNGWSSSAPAADSSGTVSAWISSLTANSSASFTLVVQVNSNATAGAVISNTASVGPITSDPTPSDNSVSFQTTVLYAPTVTVTDGGTYNGNPFNAVGSAVGVDGKTAVSGSFSYTYYASDGTTVLSGAPTNAGSYYVTAAFTSSDSNYANATSAETSFTIKRAPLSVTAVNFSATAGALFSGTVATITNNVDPLGSADYTAVIAWGDGTTSSGTISGSGSTLTVTGSHIFADPVNETVTVTISNNQGNTTTATVSDTATVTSLGKNVTTGLTGGIGFWHNMNGQALIDSFNGGPNATALATWLATMFPNLYGANAGSNNLTGETNAQVAAYFQTLFKMGGTQVQAQTLAIALNIYATTSSLGGNAGVAYGFTVTAWGLGAYSYNVGSDGGAFGVPNNSTRNVYELLMAVNNKAVNGVLYNGNATLQSEAADLFNKLNKAGSIG